MTEPGALVRLVYCSRSSALPPQRETDVVAIRDAARLHNARNGISGLLVVADAYYLQVIEGAPEDIDALYARIEADARHCDVTILQRVWITERQFSGWALGLMERSESAESASRRIALLRERLAQDESANAHDFFRLLFAPGAPRDHRSEGIRNVALASPGGLWNAGVLQRIAGDSRQRVERTALIEAVDVVEPGNRTLVEYVDVDVAGAGPTRVFSLNRAPSHCMPLAPLLDNLELIVLMVAASDLAALNEYLNGWFAMLPVRRARPKVLLATSLRGERLDELTDYVHTLGDLAFAPVHLRLSDTDAIWRMAQKALREPLPRQPRPDRRSAPSAADAPLHPAEPEPLPPASQPSKLERLLVELNALCVALLQLEPPAVLSVASREVEREDALDGELELLRAKHDLVRRLDPAEAIEDIVVSSPEHLRVYRAVPDQPSLFLFAKLAREATSPALVRLKLQETVADGGWAELQAP